MGVFLVVVGDFVLVVVNFWRVLMIDCFIWILYGMDVVFCVLLNWFIIIKLLVWVVVVEFK